MCWGYGSFGCGRRCGAVSGRASDVSEAQYFSALMLYGSTLYLCALQLMRRSRGIDLQLVEDVEISLDLVWPVTYDPDRRFRIELRPPQDGVRSLWRGDR